MARPGRLQRLEGAQLLASDPRDLVWLSASAGTGKTHVLSARVLRLLLAGAPPESILCLTFTKAGAAEMADRIQARLADWVRLAESKLRMELFNLGERNDAAAIAFARTLFARVLEATGGGLRIQTIHAFCQTLLAGFPAEAGLAPGFRPLDGRAEAALARTTLAELLVAAERGGDLGLIRDVQTLSLRLGEADAERYLLECSRAPDAMAALGPREGIEARLRQALDVPLGDVETAIANACADDAFDCLSLNDAMAANARWGGARGSARAATIDAWLAADGAARAAALGDLHQIWATAAGDPRSFAKGQSPQEDGYPELATSLFGQVSTLLGLRARADLAALLAGGLRAGQAYARAYAEAKRRAGLVDFDDLIRSTVRLLASDGMGDWVRYKLDQATDHILVDEAQDTNADQWSIVAALAGEYFAGAGAKAGRHRTIFTVGDFKQAIFGFQGTNPQAFEAARRSFSRKAEDAERGFLDLSLEKSFRSTPPVLALVDRVIADLGGEAMGLVETARDHASARDALPGVVTLWRPVTVEREDKEADADEAGEAEQGEEGWIDDATRRFATTLARQIRAWLDAPLWLGGKGRALRPEDVLILVKRRGTLASLLVARLHAEGVPVAGVDRLRLDAPLAVRDLLAAMRFAVQPEDDLTLAALLVSPLVGWDQARLYDVGFRRPASLWRAVRDRAPETAVAIEALLARADFITPHRFLEYILSGPINGRRRLLSRLGAEARDPIEELVNAALQFEDNATPSLQRFLDWFDRGEVDITRDPSAPLDAVRVMTVHGAKGLQAPLVILADATVDPDKTPRRPIGWAVTEEGGKVPIPRPRKAERAGPIDAAVAAIDGREREEHWRLLYVALTRAEEHLVVAGALGPRARGVPPQASWYRVVDSALEGLGAGWSDDALWSGARHYRGPGAAAPRTERARRPLPGPLAASPLPVWLHAPAPKEARPPRPLAPSALGTDDVADPPPGPALRAAAERGRLLHALFERLPAVPPADRVAAAERWLSGGAGVADEAERRALIVDACAIIADPAHTALFSPDALAEAPIAAVVAGEVVAGTVDRLLVTPDRVLVVDFKTGRRPPAAIDAVPIPHLKQMAAYAAALGVIFPDRPVEAALLYTAGPTLLTLPGELLDRHKPGFVG